MVDDRIPVNIFIVCLFVNVMFSFFFFQCVCVFCGVFCLFVFVCGVFVVFFCLFVFVCGVYFLWFLCVLIFCIIK